MCIKNVSEVAPFPELFAHIIYRRQAKISALLIKLCLLLYCLPNLARLVLKRLLTTLELFAHLPCHRISALQVISIFLLTESNCCIFGEQTVTGSEQNLLFTHRYLLTFLFAYHFLLTENPLPTCNLPHARVHTVAYTGH